MAINTDTLPLDEWLKLSDAELAERRRRLVEQEANPEPVAAVERQDAVQLAPQVPEVTAAPHEAVRTPTVDAHHGMADLDDGGAGLVLQVRSAGPHPIGRGDRVVLVEHDAQANTWRVMPERDLPLP